VRELLWICPLGGILVKVCPQFRRGRRLRYNLPRQTGRSRRFILCPDKHRSIKFAGLRTDPRCRPRRADRRVASGTAYASTPSYLLAHVRTMTEHILSHPCRKPALPGLLAAAIFSRSRPAASVMGLYGQCSPLTYIVAPAARASRILTALGLSPVAIQGWCLVRTSA